MLRIEQVIKLQQLFFFLSDITMKERL